MKPMLPALKGGAGNSLMAFTTSSWEPRPWAELKRLAESLDVPVASPGKTSIDAIPDIWARSLLFAYALAEPDHAVHSRAVGSFRGVLALLALRERKHFPLQVSEVQITQASKNRFVEALYRLLPQAVLGPETAWERAFVFHRNNQPLAVTSPLTLVCPNEGLHVPGLSQIPWWRDGSYFGDPTEFLPTSERQNLAAWVSQLQRQIAGGTAAGPQLSILLGLLDTFRRDLSDGMEEEGVADFSDSSLPLTFGVYRHLGRALKAAEISSADSDLRLHCDREGSPAEILILDREIADQWNTDPSQISVIEGLSLADLRNFDIGANPARIGTLIAFPQGTEWRSPASFFTERLYLLEGKDALPGAATITGCQDVASGRKATPILPIRSELLQYLKASTIQERVRFQKLDGGIQVTFDIPVANERTVRVSKIYSGEGIETLKAKPTLEVWPRFSSEVWRQYFTYWGNSGYDTFYATPFSRQPVLETAREGNEVEICRLSSPPEAFVCTYKQKRAAGNRDVEIGLILLSLPAPPSVMNREFSVGVDFGTTNTNIYLAAADGTIEALSLSVTTHQVTAADNALRAEGLNKRFLPTQAENPTEIDTAPFLSFFRIRPGVAGPMFEPIREGHILFFKPIHTQAELQAGRVHSNLKWQLGSEAMVKAYLQQICLHVCAEAIQKGAVQLHWHYSLPSAFSAKTRGDFRALWSQLQTWVKENTGLAGKEVQRQTESVSAAKYFLAAEGATPAVGIAILDIGGGTTDISIWQKNRLVYQASVKLAGRELLLQPFYRLRNDLLPVLGRLQSSPPGIKELAKAPSEDQFYAHLEALLKSRGDVWAQEIQFLQGESPVQALVQKLRLGISGLLFYVGLLIKHAEAHVGYDRKLQGVYIGGNGSKLFNWISAGTFSSSAEVNSLLTKCLVTGAGWDNGVDSFQLRLSNHPKAEAAYGLVVQSHLAQNEVFDEQAGRSVPAGEPFGAHGNFFSDVDLISSLNLQDGAEVSDLPNLRRFLSTYSLEAKRMGYPVDATPTSAAVDADVLAQVQQWIRDQEQRPEDSIQVNPVFIVGLRQLLIV